VAACVEEEGAVLAAELEGDLVVVLAILEGEVGGVVTGWFGGGAEGFWGDYGGCTQTNDY
jgi:hypothetical protein